MSQAAPHHANPTPAPAAEATPEVALAEGTPEVAPAEGTPEVAPAEGTPEVAPAETTPEATPAPVAAEATPAPSAPAAGDSPRLEATEPVRPAPRCAAPAASSPAAGPPSPAARSPAAGPRSPAAGGAAARELSPAARSGAAAAAGPWRSSVRALTAAAPDAEKCQVWQRQVRDMHRSRCAPEVLEQVRRRAEIQRRASESATWAGHLSRCSAVMETSWSAGTRRGGQAETAEERGARAERSRTHMDSIRTLTITRDDAQRTMGLDAVEQDVHVTNTISLSTGAVVHACPDDDVRTVLQQLVQEPSCDEECSEKFQLYEDYSATVSTLRGELMKFWDESREVFDEGRAREEAHKELQSIDNTVALGIHDEAREWFVHQMLSKAHRNNRSMRVVLNSLKRKLEILAKCDECPVCLEGLDGVECETLGCCHKVCAGCWANWTVMQGGRPFCPLCRHDAFIQAVVSGE